MYVDNESWIGGPTQEDSDGNLLWQSDVGSVQDTFVADYKGCDCTTTCGDSTLPLATGEVALYTQCNDGGLAMVFSTDVDDLSIYDSAAAANLAIGKNAARSVRVGPDTLDSFDIVQTSVVGYIWAYPNVTATQ